MDSSYFGNRPNTVSESTVSNTELSEFFALRAPQRELSEFLSAYYCCDKVNSPKYSARFLLLRDSEHLMISMCMDGLGM